MAHLLLLCLLACTPQTKWLTYTDATNKFTINYPDKWVKKNNVNSIVFLSPKENDKDLFQENLNLMLQDLSKKPMNLEQYTELTKKQIVDNLGASAIVSLKNVTISGQQGKEFVYNMNYQGNKLKVKQCWIIKNHNAYLLTYTAEPEQYNKYENIAVEMMNSFKLL